MNQLSKTDVGSAARDGLTEAQVEQSRRTHGANLLTRRRGKSFLRQFLSNLNDPVIRILLGALVVHLLLVFRNGDWVETAGIGIAVFLAALISTLSERGSARAFERLSEEGARGVCRVRREGRVRQLPIGEVVVGDCVLLSSGEMIPADGRLIEGEIRSDQSAMTGESCEVEKRASASFSADPASPAALFRGCTVTSGSCEMVVTAVGDASYLGGISQQIQEDTRQSPLKLRLTRLARQISLLGYLAAALVTLVSLFNSFVLDSGMEWELICLKLRDLPYLLQTLLRAFTMGLTVIVMAVPEGLPMMIAVVLSSNIRRMIRDRVLVRKPVGIEAAGSMNLLLTDKTGTLTEGRMRVAAMLAPDGSSSDVAGWMEAGGLRAELTSLAFHFCSEATRGVDGEGRPSALGGSATDRALLTSVLRYPPQDGWRMLSRLPFDSSRKYSAVSLRGQQTLTLLLGAPERLLPYLSDGLTASGDTAVIARGALERRIAELTGSGGRVLLLAAGREGIPAAQYASGVRGSLTLIGGVCLYDPLRPEAGEAVAALQDAGIGVVMITGDNRDTAAYLARRCGILCSERDLVLTGEELGALGDAELRERLPRLAVVARALPQDKSRLVQLAQEAGLVTGMTGDGINDAPALRRADVGFAMGNGTQVAKDAGDVVILDNNLASIVRAVLYGRNIFKSIRKFITLQLTMNLCALGVSMICPFLGIDAPVTVVQMLWINMIMDTLGGLAFAGEPALPECMRERPKRRDEPILNRYMINQILLLGGFTVALCIFFLKSPTVSALFRPSEDRIYHLTAFFALFIFSSVFNCFHARTDRLRLWAGLRQNPVFLLIMGLILVIQILFVYLGGSVLRTAPLTLRELLVTLALSSAVFPAEMIRRALWRLCGRHDGF